MRELDVSAECDNVIHVMSTFPTDPFRTGVAVAAAIGVSLAVVGVTLNSDPSSVLAYVLPLSLPVGVLLAWRHSRAVGSSPRYPMGRVILMAVQAVVVGALLVGATLAAVEAVNGRGQFATLLDGIGRVFWLAALGIMFMGIPMLALILPVVAIWAVLVRRLSQPSR